MQHIQNIDKLLVGSLLFVLGQAMGFFQLNLRYFSPWWAERGLLAVALFAFPVAITFWYAWGFTMEGLGSSAWGARFMSFGLSYLVFPFLSYAFLGENMFEVKTMVCVALSVAIIMVQVLA